jgi:hypothetical protein
MGVLGYASFKFTHSHKGKIMLDLYYREVAGRGDIGVGPWTLIKPGDIIEILDSESLAIMIKHETNGADPSESWFGQAVTVQLPFEMKVTQLTLRFKDGKKQNDRDGYLGGMIGSREVSLNPFCVDLNDGSTMTQGVSIFTGDIDPEEGFPFEVFVAWVPHGFVPRNSVS